MRENQGGTEDRKAHPMGAERRREVKRGCEECEGEERSMLGLWRPGEW